jgi:hypothetical protein
VGPRLIVHKRALRKSKELGCMHVHPQREEGKSKDWRVMEMCFTQIEI